MQETIRDNLKTETETITAEDCNSSHFGQVTFLPNSLKKLEKFGIWNFSHQFPGFCTGDKNRTHDLRFWRPMLYQLSYTRFFKRNNINQIFL